MARLTKREGSERWYAWIPRPGGGTRLVSTNCSDKRAAQTRADELERESLDPAHQAANQATTRDACELYIASRKRAGRAAGTLHHYGVKLSHAARLLPEMLRSVTGGALETYTDKREAEGAARTTVKKELRAIGAMLRHAKRKGLYAPDIAQVMPEYADDYEPRKTRLTLDELGRLISALEGGSGDGALNRAAMAGFIVATGARWGEAVRAQAGDIDLQGGHVHLRGTKTKRALRDVPITPLSRHILEAVALSVRGRSGKLFDPWTNVVRDLAVACKQAQVPRVTPNDLRRTFGSWLRARGIAPDLIGDAMGHVDSRMVLRVYGRLQPGELGHLLAAGLADRTVGYVSGAGAESGDPCPLLAEQNPAVSAENTVPRDGIEPPTRGFSIPSYVPGIIEGYENFGADCRVGVTDCWVCCELERVCTHLALTGELLPVAELGKGDIDTFCELHRTLVRSAEDAVFRAFAQRRAGGAA